MHRSFLLFLLLTSSVHNYLCLLNVPEQYVLFTVITIVTICSSSLLFYNINTTIVESVKLQIPWTKLTSGGLHITADNVSIVFRLHRRITEDEFDDNDPESPLPDKMVYIRLFHTNYEGLIYANRIRNQKGSFPTLYSYLIYAVFCLFFSICSSFIPPFFEPLHLNGKLISYFIFYCLYTISHTSHL